MQRSTQIEELSETTLQFTSKKHKLSFSSAVDARIYTNKLAFLALPVEAGFRDGIQPPFVVNRSPYF